MNSLKEVLYLGNQLEVRGGTPTSVDTLAPLLRKEGFAVITASAKNNKLLRLLDMMVIVWRHRKTVNYVLIDTYSTQNFWYTYAVALLCQKLHLKYIPILHGGELPRRLKSSLRASEKIFKNAFLNVAPSLYLKSEFETAGYHNLRYIPNSIEIKNYPFLERRNPRPKLLWVRAFAEIYNPLLALQVLELLLTKYPKAELCMVGAVKDESFDTCKRAASEKRLPVTFPGKLEKEEWISLSTEYDIFLNTTNVDNTPISVIEAMALGLPVISSNVGGLPFLISADIDGILVPPNDAARMAKAVENIIEDPTRSLERTRLARKKTEAFDWQIVKQDWLNLLMK